MAIWHKFYDDVPQSIKYTTATLPDMLSQSAVNFPIRTSMVFFGNKISFLQLEKLSNKFANALVSLGIKKGDRVALLLPNIPQTVIAYYSILKIGAIIVQINPLLTDDEIDLQLKDSKTKLIVCLDILFKRFKDVIIKVDKIIITKVNEFLPFLLKCLYPIKSRIDRQYVKVVYKPPFYKFDTLLDNNVSKEPDIKINSEDLALIQYTGGTTGLPKGAMLTHYNLVANTFQVKTWLSNFEDGKEVILAVLPFFHVYGMTVCMNLAILGGSTLILLPKFSAKEVIKAINKYKPTIFPGVPIMYSAINEYKDVEKYDLSSIKACISGAGALPSEVQKQFEELTNGKLVEGYGLTEASPVTHCNPVYGRRKIGSIGIPLPDTSVKIVDLEDDGKILKAGEVGELCVKGPQVMKGYWNNKEETDKTIKDGWLYTGDIAKMDEDGFFFIVERKKEMIKIKGEKVYPKEVEDVLIKYSKVKESAVIGVFDKEHGEKIKACVVLHRNEKATKDEIIEFCKTKLARFKIPQEVEFIDEIPKTIIGKVLRRKLKEDI